MVVGRFDKWVERANIHHNYVTGGDDLWLWGKHRIGLIASIWIDRTFNAMDFVNRRNMQLVYTTEADDGKTYNVYEDEKQTYIVAIPA